VSDILGRYGLVDDGAAAARWTTDALNGMDLREHSVDPERYAALLRARRRGYLTDLGASDDVLELLVDELEEHSRQFRMEPYADATLVVDWLHGRNVPMAVCSNWDWELEPYIDDAGFADRFVAAISSSRCGYRKPHPGIYAAAMRALGDGPEGLAYVGDSWVPDVVGPREAGLCSVYLRRPDRPGSAARSEPPVIPPDVLCIEDLRSMMEW
jgi:putative hydrolase of the HAD superfamily